MGLSCRHRKVEIRGDRMKTEGHRRAPRADRAKAKDSGLGLEDLEQMTRSPQVTDVVVPQAGAAPPGATHLTPFDSPVVPRHESTSDLTDPLTGLAKRLLLLDRLGKAQDRRRVHGGHVVAFHIELNNFSFVHDQLGTSASNAILQEISHRLLSLLRSEDMVGRVGPSELVVAVSLPDQSAAAHLTERLQAAFESDIVLNDREVHMWATLVSVDALDDESAEDILYRLNEVARLKTAGRSPAWPVSLEGR